ncbi:MAG: hypothetical protein WC738_03385 [Candidatus Omnitrophota bacterium]|jgi:Tol biopolymer transport system component
MKRNNARIIIFTLILTSLYIAIPCMANDDVADNIKGKFTFEGIRNPKLGWGVYVLSLKDAEPKFLGSKMTGPRWSPNGTKIAVSGADGILILNENGNIIETIKPMINYRPQPIEWSPNGDEILYATTRKGEEQKHWRTCLYIYNLKTKQHNLILNLSGKYSILSPSFSPDGKQILVSLTDEQSGIYILNKDGSGVEKLRKNAMAVGWFPDGKSICFDTNIGDDGNLMNPKRGYGYLFKYNLENKSTEKIREFGFTLDAKLSKDGKYVYYIKPIGRGAHVICVSPIDDEKIEIQITKPVLLGNSGKYSEEFSPDWYQGE